ncbi:hypothetical protein PCE1_001932 [Barthelona sp. PCE]
MNEKKDNSVSRALRAVMTIDMLDYFKSDTINQFSPKVQEGTDRFYLCSTTIALQIAFFIGYIRKYRSVKVLQVGFGNLGRRLIDVLSKTTLFTNEDNNEYVYCTRDVRKYEGLHHAENLVELTAELVESADILILAIPFDQHTVFSRRFNDILRGNQFIFSTASIIKKKKLEMTFNTEFNLHPCINYQSINTMLQFESFQRVFNTTNQENFFAISLFAQNFDIQAFIVQMQEYTMCDFERIAGDFSFSTEKYRKLIVGFDDMPKTSLSTDNYRTVCRVWY